MVRAVETNLEMIRHVARRLGDLRVRDRVVFLGDHKRFPLLNFQGVSAGQGFP